ncbi:hypothetical protein [Planobispora takensis]|uniref:Uncharacterized protein n=1 Tax=Planobispora takensis TaxID=1367882 RepID=A0A8J3WRY0_9ACTN|nr:hypothetical protein [Planobispora takensis]GIH98627.1 hypothetical protein Pta02_06360 [Planobispora takensis]
MHAPSSSGRTEPPGEPEILTGPAGDPSPRRKPGPAVVVASALVAAAVGAGSVFAFVHFTGDDRDASPAPGVSGAPQSPGSAQEADDPADPGVSDPDNVTSGADGADGTEGADGPDGSDGSGENSGDGRRGGDGPGADPAESGSGSGSGDETDSSSSGGRGDVQTPPLEDGAVDPRADGEPGFVPPKGPIGGY